MKTVRNLGLLTAAAALAFTFTPVFGFSRANADDVMPATEATAPGNQPVGASTGSGTGTGTTDDHSTPSGKANRAGASGAPGSNAAPASSGSQAGSTSASPENSKPTTSGSPAGSTKPNLAAGSGAQNNAGSQTNTVPAIETKEVDGIEIPVGKPVTVVNPYYINDYDSVAFADKTRAVKALQAADSNVTGATFEQGTGKVTVSYKDGTAKETSIDVLIENGFFEYTVSVKKDSHGNTEEIITSEKPPLPEFYNNGDATVRPKKNRYGHMYVFRADYNGEAGMGNNYKKTQVSMKLQNTQGSHDQVFGNGTWYVAKDNDGYPIVDFNSNGLGGFKIHRYDTKMNGNGSGYEKDSASYNNRQISRIPDKNAVPYKFYTLSTFATEDDPIPLNQKLDTYRVVYTIHRAGETDDTKSGAVDVTVLPLKERYEPQRDPAKNSSSTPLQLTTLGGDLPFDKVNGVLNTKRVEIAGHLAKKSGACEPGGKNHCFSFQSGRATNVSLPEKLKDSSGTKNTRFKYVEDIPEKGLPIGVKKVKVAVMYPDNQTGDKNLVKGADKNPDGDSVDYVDIYVKLPVKLTPLEPAANIPAIKLTPAPKPAPAPSPQPQPSETTQPKPKPEESPDSKPKVIPGDGDDTPEGYVTVTFEPGGKSNTGGNDKPAPREPGGNDTPGDNGDKPGGNDKPGGDDKPAPREPETKETPKVSETPKVIETPSSGESKVRDPQPTPVKDPNNLTPEEKQKVREEIKKSNPDLGLPDDKIHVADNGEVTIFMPDNSVVKIPPVKGVSQYADPQNPGVLGENTPGKSLPNTGVNTTPAVLTATALLLLGILLTLRSRSLAYVAAARHRVQD